MTHKQSNLQKVLGQVYVKRDRPYPRATWELVARSKFKSDFLEVYHDELGGTQEQPELFGGFWQMSYEGFAVALDEELNFNRYRNATLRAEFYRKNESFSVQQYRNWCRKHEIEATKQGSRGDLWDSALGRKNFGPSEEPGDKGGKGSNAWKQRALEDFANDIAMYELSHPLIRVSIYENLMLDKQLYQIGKILMTPLPSQVEAFLKYFQRKRHQLALKEELNRPGANPWDIV